MKKTKQIAFSGMLAALSFTLMFFGSIIWAFTYISPLVCGIIMIIICDILGKRNAFLTYAAVSALSIAFLPDKECALTYVFFFGYYVIIRDSLEKIKPAALRRFVKFLIYNVGIISSQLVLIYVFGIPFDGFWGIWGVIILIVLANIIFIFYEKALSRLIIIYDKKYKSRVNRMLK